MSRRTIDFIDLTKSTTLDDHKLLPNEVINLDSDDSFITEVQGSPAKQDKPNLSSMKILNSQMHHHHHQVLSSIENVPPRLGECPICWEVLGTNPLASTKCGHIFCLKCLKTVLSKVKKCPTCRSNLGRKSAYHPLYLDHT